MAAVLRRGKSSPAKAWCSLLSLVVLACSSSNSTPSPTGDTGPGSRDGATSGAVGDPSANHDSGTSASSGASASSGTSGTSRVEAGGASGVATSGAVGADAGAGGPGGLGGIFRFGINHGHRNASWGDELYGQLSSRAGCNSVRLKLPETHLTTWGYEIELSDVASYGRNGLGDLVAFLIQPTRANSTAPSTVADWELEYYMPTGLHEPIWSEAGVVNPANPWANYVAETVSTYRGSIHLWEVWNEPDWVSDYNATLQWATRAPTKEELVRFHGSLFDYVRMLRITYEVAHHLDPEARIALGGIGYPNFLAALLRSTDEARSGSVDAEHPAKGGSYFDVLSFHHYPVYTRGNSDVALDSFVAQHTAMVHELTKAGISGKDVIATETGAPHRAIGTFPGGAAYARNYLVKVMAKAQALGMEAVHWYSLSDGADSKDPYAWMGLYEDIATVASIDDAQKTESATALTTYSKLLAGARVEPSAALPSGADGVSFTTASGHLARALWVRGDGEEAHATVTLDNPGPIDVVAWDGTTTQLGPAASVELSSSPVIVVAR